MNNVILTGATGFVGKVVLFDLLSQKEKLNIDKIFLIIRDKGVRTAKSRFNNEISKSPLFDSLSNKKILESVIPISGEISLKNCDLSDEDTNNLISNTTHIIHCAASVDFDLPIEEATISNIDASINLLELAKKCKNLKKMVAVSTAYVTPHREGEIKEELHILPFDAEDTYKDIKLGIADEVRLLKQSGHPNTYTLTKCLSENIIFNRKENVPLTIVRPSIVSSTLKNPYPGWIDSASTIAAFVVLQSIGYCKIINNNKNTKLNFVPCDIVSENIIKETFSTYTGFNIRYAISAGIKNAPTQVELAKIMHEYFSKYKHGKKPIDWEFADSQNEFIVKDFFKNKLLLNTIGFFNKKSSEKIKKLHSKVDRILSLFEYFTNNTFDFVTKHNDVNIEYDQLEYTKILTEGVSKRILKYNPKMVPFSGKNFRNPEISDEIWSLTNNTDKLSIKIGSYLLRKNLPKINSLITFDIDSFYSALKNKKDENIIIIPSHRSYLDFLLCSYLFYAYPELGIKVPYIAATDDFAKIPVLGAAFKSMKAFYIKRGVGKEDPQLTQKVNELVLKNENIQFFIEGTRSRTRKFLKPKTGMLKCLQNTGKDFIVLPISISYDKLPEENSIIEELKSSNKPKMKLTKLISWYKDANKGKVSLGKIHIKCGQSLKLTQSSDVKSLAKDILGELQKNTIITTYHLKSFLKHNDCDLTLDDLKQLLVDRGAEIIESDLDFENDSFNEIILRQQWIHYFYSDAIKRYKNNDIIKYEIETNKWYQVKEGKKLSNSKFLDSLFYPLLNNSKIIIDELKADNFRSYDELQSNKNLHPIYIKEILKFLIDKNIIKIENEKYVKSDSFSELEKIND